LLEQLFEIDDGDHVRIGPLCMSVATPRMRFAVSVRANEAIQRQDCENIA